MKYGFLVLLILEMGLPCFASPLKLGKPAPDFELVDFTGEKFSLGKLKGEIVVLEWTSPNCPFVLGHYERGTIKSVHDKYGKKVKWIGIDSNYTTSPSQIYSWTIRWKLPYPVLHDKTGVVGKSYGAKNTPQVYVIDRKGLLRYQGAVDNDPTETKAKPMNYLEEALEAVISGKPVKIGETKPYGCGIQYFSF